MTKRALHEAARLVIVCGLPGSGKSYFAHKLAMLISGHYINSDVLRRSILRDRTYSSFEKALVYTSMLAACKEHIEDRNTIVLDATFHTIESRKPFVELPVKHLTIIKVWAKERIIKERLSQSRRYSEADFGVYQLIRDAWEPLTIPHLVLESTNDNIEYMLEKALEYMDGKDDS